MSESVLFSQMCVYINKFVIVTNSDNFRIDDIFKHMLSAEYGRVDYVINALCGLL